MLKPYPDYKESGIEWLGDVPKHWEVRPAVSVSQVLTSTVDKKSYEGELPVRLCNYTDVYYNNVVVDNPDFMKATATPDQIASFTPRAGDVVITKDSETSDDIGIPAYVPADLPGVVFGYHLAIYRPLDPRSGRFLKYLFDSKYVKVVFLTNTPGVTRVGLSQRTLKYLRIPFPPMKEQQAIADYLDQETSEIDAFIADQEELIQLLAERKSATISQVVTKGLNPSVPMTESGIPWLGDIPRHWRLQRLWTMYSREKNIGFPDEQMLSVFRDYGVILKSSRNNINKTAENRNIYQLVEPGWLVANRMKAWQGSVGISQYRGIVSGHYICFRPYHREDHGFLNMLFRSLPYTAGYQTISRGVRIGQAEIDNDEYRLLPVLLPPLEEQRAIVAYLDRETTEIDAAIADAREAIELSKERRSALISAAVTGEIDVRQQAKALVLV